VVVASFPFLAQSFGGVIFLLNALPSGKFMLLYFAPCRPLARPHRRSWQNLPCLHSSGLVLFFYKGRVLVPVLMGLLILIFFLISKSCTIPERFGRFS
jgi:hypothetical protein